MLLVVFVCVSVGMQASNQSDGMNDARDDINNMRKPHAAAGVDHFMGGRDDFRRLMPEHRSRSGDQSKALNDARDVVKNMSNYQAKVVIGALLNDRKSFIRLLPEFRSSADSLLKKLENISLDEQKNILEILWQEVLLDALAEEEKLDRKYAKNGISRTYYL